MVSSLVRAVPVIARHTEDVARLELDLPVVLRSVAEDCLLLVLVLAAVVPNVVQGLEPVAGVCVVLLHYLVGNSADLTAEGADQVVRQGQEVNVLDDSPQGTVGVSDKYQAVTHKTRPADLPGAHSSCPGYFLVPQELNVWVLLPALSQHSRLV